MSSFRRADCRLLVTACRAKGLKATTVRGIARTLSTILSQAVEDELLPANPAFRLGKYLRAADDPEPTVDPFTADESTQILAVAHERFPDWYPWLLCGLRTGLRAGELLALQWSDFNWRYGFVQVQRNIVGGQLTTPKNHQRRRVDLSRQLQAALRLWRRGSGAPGCARGCRSRRGSSRRSAARRSTNPTCARRSIACWMLPGCTAAARIRCGTIPRP